MFQSSASSAKARRDLLNVACPRCGALPGYPCRNKNTGLQIRYWTSWHSSRFGALGLVQATLRDGGLPDPRAETPPE